MLQSLYSLSSPSHLFPPFLGLSIANKKLFKLSIKVWFSFFVDDNCLHCTFMDKNRVLTKLVRKSLNSPSKFVVMYFANFNPTRNPSLFTSYPFFLEGVFDHHRRPMSSQSGRNIHGKSLNFLIYHKLFSAQPEAGNSDTSKAGYSPWLFSVFRTEVSIALLFAIVSGEDILAISKAAVLTNT